jgi:hypothetical protein
MNKKKKQEAILFSSVISGILIASSLLSISSQLIQEVRAQNMTNQPRTNATANQTDMDNATTTTIISPLSPSCCPSNGYIANAGPDQTVLEGTIITLNGSSNNNNNNNRSSNVGDTANYLWRQTEGPAVILNDNNTAHPTFVAPNYPNDTKYAFALEVSENQDVNNNNNNQTGSEIDTLEIISKDVNMKTKNPGSLQEADNIEDQSSQDELQDEGTTGNDG